MTVYRDPSGANICQGLDTVILKVKRLIVELRDGISPEGLLVRSYDVTFMNRERPLASVYPALLISVKGGLHRVRMWRHWDRESHTFLMEFDPATEEEAAVHEVMTG